MFSSAKCYGEKRTAETRCYSFFKAIISALQGYDLKKQLKKSTFE